jgi:hypothetical protein
MILASACLAALLTAVPASAQILGTQITGTLGGDYSRVTDAGGADIYGVSGSLATAIGSGWNFEGTANYHNTSPGSLDLWGVGGNLFTNTGFGRIAAGASHGGVNFGHATQYGAGADWFYSDNLTLSLKGGGHYTSGGVTGGFVGGQASWYFTPNLALSGSAEFIGSSAGDINSQTIKGEWQVSDTFPLAVSLGYQRYEAAGTDLNTVFVGLKFYFDGAPTLVGHHRTGSLGYIGQSVFQLGNR